MLEALFLLGYREANSEGFSVWGKYGQIGEYVVLYVTLKMAAGDKVVIRQNVANDPKGFTAHQESEPKKKLP